MSESFHDAEKSGLRYRVHRDDQVVRLSAGESDRAELAPRARDVAGDSRFTSAALLALKAKQVDDGVLAAVELAAQRGVGTFDARSWRAHESELVKRLFGDRPVPADLDLPSELVKRIRSGEVDLTPRETSGWYDVRTWALETVAAPERGPESKRLELARTYVDHLELLFRAILTATRKTHATQLEVPRAASLAVPANDTLNVAPHLTVEPLVTYYERRADAYRFVRALLVETFGEAALGTIYGLRSGSAVAEPLGVELASMIHLFDGAAATAMRELGMVTGWDHTAFTAWRGGETDPDVAPDLRSMVPVSHDVERGRTRVWLMLGWTQRPLHASFARPPRVEVLGGAPVNVDFGSVSHPLATPVMVETHVSKLLDRDELRKLCDRHRTCEAIVAALT